MYKKKKNPEKEVEIVIEAPKPQPDRRVTFAAWFEKAKKLYRLRNHQDYALQIFFEKQGLTQNEIPERYDEVFKKF